MLGNLRTLLVWVGGSLVFCEMVALWCKRNIPVRGIHQGLDLIQYVLPLSRRQLHKRLFNFTTVLKPQNGDVKLIFLIESVLCSRRLNLTHIDYLLIEIQQQRIIFFVKQLGFRS